MQCSVQLAVCIWQCAVCRVQSAVRRVQCAVLFVYLAVFSVQYSVCSMQFAVCSVQCSVCSVQCSVCSVQRYPRVTVSILCTTVGPGRTPSRVVKFIFRGPARGPLPALQINNNRFKAIPEYGRPLSQWSFGDNSTNSLTSLNISP